MATLSVRNVGPIREADLEVKKHTVFIGPQGSGKSTLAKLIAIGGDTDMSLFNQRSISHFERKYDMEEFFQKESKINFLSERYSLSLSEEFIFDFYNREQKVDENESLLDILDEMNDMHRTFPYSEDDLKNLDFLLSSQRSLLIPPITEEEESKLKEYRQFMITMTKRMGKLSSIVQQRIFKEYESNYIPVERILNAKLSDAIWSILNSEINLPKTIISFSKDYQNSRSEIKSLPIEFLKISYHYQQGRDKVEIESEKIINLSQSASGYQSIIPLLLVVEHQRRQSKRRFIIEEPELNLYPTTQKDLIYNLMSGLDPAVTYQEAEWVITTHSPYVLSSFNTLMLAWKVAHRSEALRAEVEQIIPERCWINPDEFAAYYVDNGTVRSIISETTGLIADNELDDVSEDFAGEQDRLLDLYRSVIHA